MLTRSVGEQTTGFGTLLARVVCTVGVVASRAQTGCFISFFSVANDALSEFGERIIKWHTVQSEADWSKRQLAEILYDILRRKGVLSFWLRRNVPFVLLLL